MDMHRPMKLEGKVRTGRRLGVLGALALLCAAATRVPAAPPVADPAAGANRPKVETTGNGTPLVQITNPSAGGVSRNQFTRFDVDPGGLILNNSTTLTRTQLAGWIPNNPNLCKPASVILNEVTGGDPSRLLGIMEVAGPKAEVVVANPNGITCSGCGFINVSRGTLTTGTPVFGGAGSLDAYRVVGGSVAVEGAGLDARGLDQVDLISRAVTANAGIWASRLNVITGANQVDRGSLAATPIDGQGAAPALSLDIGALGGMYAGKIQLVGTESGVGVRSEGTLASEGEFKLESNGQVVLQGSTTSAGAMQVRASSLDSHGTLYSGGSLDVGVTGALSTTGLLAAQGDVTIQADRITLGGLTGAGLSPEGQVTGQSALKLVAANGIVAPGQQLVSGGGIVLDGGTLNLAGADLKANGSASLTARSGAIDVTGARVDAGDALTASATGGDIQNTDGSLAAQGSITVSTTGTFDNTNGLVLGNEVEISADQIRSQGALAAIVSAGDMRLYAPTALVNADGSLIYAGRDLLIAGAPAADSSSDPALAASVANRSAQIEAGGNAAIYATEFRNEKSVYEYTYDTTPTTTASSSTPVSDKSYPGSFFVAFVPEDYDWGDHWSTKLLIVETLTYPARVTANSDPSTLRAGGNITLRGGTVVNDQSLTAAGGALVDTGVSFSQPALPSTEVVTQEYVKVHATRIKPCHGDGGCTEGHYPDGADFQSTPIVKSDVFETAPNNAQSLQNTGTGPSAPSVAAAAPQIALPSNRLFTIHPDPSSRYLVETDPRFTKLGNFITSDYLLNQLPVHPDMPLKRLGDGFYEERLVMDELFRATGTPYLPGYSDAMAQYQALMDQGMVYARKFNLSPGIALSAEQTIQLTSPIVWMVKVNVNGQDVLAPRVYVPSGKEVALTGAGKVVAGGSATWKLSGGFDAAGQVSTGKELSVSAGSVRSTAGSFTAGGDAGLQATGAVQLDAASVAAGGNVSIGSSTGDVRFGSSTHQETQDGASVSRVVATNVTAGGTIDIQAANDLQLTAARIQGTSGVSLAAGHDLTLSTAEQITRSGSSENGRNAGTTKTEQVGTSIDAKQGAVQITATRNAQLEGANVTAGGDVLLAAGGDLSLTAAKTTVESAEQQGRRFTNTLDETVTGTTVQAGGAITLAALGTSDGSAGRVSLEAATVQAGGQLTVAGKDVSITDAREEHDTLTTDTTHKNGFLSSKTTTTRDEVKQDLSVGSLLSGNTVLVQSGGGILVQGSQVVGQGDVALRAQGDITIAAGEDRITERHERVEKRSGLLGGTGGLGITIGTRRKSVTTDVDTVSHERDAADGTVTTTGSVIGSVAGGVEIDAQGRVDTRGSDITAKGDVSIAGQDVLVDSVYDITRTHQVTTVTQDGFSVGISNGVIDSGLDAYQAGHRAEEVKDQRLQALYELRMSRNTYAAADKLKSFTKSPSLNISLGATHSESRTEYTSESSAALGSSIISDGRVTITARGDAAQGHGDLTVVGSTVKGGNVTLDANRDIVLRSAENRLDTSTDSRSMSVSAGLGVSVGKGAPSFGGQVSGSVQKSEDDGHDRTYTETQIQSGGTITLHSGRDATLKGAIVHGEAIDANIGRNLVVESEQDTSTYHSTDLSLSGQVTFGGGVNVNANAGYAGTESSYRSVQEQTGLFAGAGGYKVHVGGNTDLRGGVIASEAAPERNLLDTGGLTYSNLSNESKYSAVSFSASVGLGGITPGAGMPIQGRKASTTYAAVSPGTIVVRDGKQNLDGLSRDTDKATNAIGNIFDKATVAERKELVQVFGEEGFKAVGDLAQHYTKPYTDAKLSAENANAYLALLDKKDQLSENEQKQLEWYQEHGYTPGGANAQLESANRTMAEHQSDYDLWKDGSPLKTALHGAVGAMQAGLGGGSILAGGVGAGTSERLSEITDNLPPSLRPIASLVIGATAARLTGAGILGTIAGGSSAEYGYQNNRKLHETESSLVARLARDHWQEWGYADEETALRRLSAAACAMAHCADGVAYVNPKRQEWLDFQALGETLTVEQKRLQAASEQEYAFALGSYRSDPKKYSSADYDNPGVLGPVGLPERAFTYNPSDARLEEFATRNSLDVRASGLAQAAQSTVPISIGVSGTAVCLQSAGATCYLGLTSLTLGVDQLTTGLATAWDGLPYKTRLNQTAQSLGFTPAQADILEFTINLGVQSQLALDLMKAPSGSGPGDLASDIAGTIAERQSAQQIPQVHPAIDSSIPRSGTAPAWLESSGAEVVPNGTVVGTAQTERSVITSIRASVAENEAYKAALARGEIGLQRPGAVNQGGTDFITATFDRTGDAWIVVNDSKASSIGSFPSPKPSVPLAWMPEVEDAVSASRLNLNDPALEATIRDAFAKGRVVYRQLNVDYSPAGQGSITGW